MAAEPLTFEQEQAVLAKHAPYITVTEGASGFYAVHVTWNEEHGGFYEPYNTGVGRYQTRQEAEEEAQWWAGDMELPYIAPKESKN